MPIYEYTCEKCTKTIEAIQKFSDPALTVCPNCNGPLKKLISRTSFQLKGSGWYASDYKKAQPSSTDSAAPIAPPKATPKTDTGKE